MCCDVDSIWLKTLNERRRQNIYLCQIKIKLATVCVCLEKINRDNNNSVVTCAFIFCKRKRLQILKQTIFD